MNDGALRGHSILLLRSIGKWAHLEAKSWGPQEVRGEKEAPKTKGDAAQKLAGVQSSDLGMPCRPHEFVWWF